VGERITDQSAEGRRKSGAYSPGTSSPNPATNHEKEKRFPKKKGRSKGNHYPASPLAKRKSRKREEANTSRQKLPGLGKGIYCKKTQRNRTRKTTTAQNPSPFRRNRLGLTKGEFPSQHQTRGQPHKIQLAQKEKEKAQTLGGGDKSAEGGGLLGRQKAGEPIEVVKHKNTTEGIKKDGAPTKGGIKAHGEENQKVKLLNRGKCEKGGFGGRVLVFLAAKFAGKRKRWLTAVSGGHEKRRGERNNGRGGVTGG